MEILITDSAKEDLRHIQKHYRELNIPNIADEQISQILDKVERLIDHPESGRIVPELKDPQIRELILPPYRVVHLLTDNSVQIIRIWRSERELELPTT